MDYFHNTTQKNAKRIVNTQRMKKSKFDVFDFIDALLEQYKYSNPLPKVIPTIINKSYVYTLGEGFYFYDNLETAKTHTKDGEIVVANIEGGNLFQLHKQKDDLLLFLENVFRVHINNTYKDDLEYLKVFNHLLDIFETEIYDDFNEYPHVAALIIDTYRHFNGHEKYNIFSNLVPKCYDESRITMIEEFAIKEHGIIQQLRMCV